MSGSWSLLQLWQIPSTKLLLSRSNLSLGLCMTPRTEIRPVLCFCKNLQTVTYEVVRGSYVPSSETKDNTSKDKSLTTQEVVGAFQKLPMVQPSIDILYSALRKAKRIAPSKGIANVAKRVRNKGAKQLDALMKELAVPLRMYKENFPNKKLLHPYERSLVELTLGDGNYEEVLGRVDALRKKVTFVGKKNAALCAKSTTKKEAEERLSEGMEKLEEIFKQDGKAVDDLITVAKSLRAMPVVDLEIPTLCLVGAPNVGKSSLVRILSTGKPEVCTNIYPKLLAMKFMDDKEARFRSLASEQVKPVNGLAKLCKWIEDCGFKRAAVTNAPKPNADLLITMLGLKEFFEIVVLAEDCERVKPFPDPYLKALKALSVSPKHTFVFEDSVSGIKAGVAAGMPVVGLATRNPERLLADAGAAFVIKDFNDLKLWTALEELENKANIPAGTI